MNVGLPGALQEKAIRAREPKVSLAAVEIEVDFHPRHGDEGRAFAGFGPGEGRHVTDSTSRSCCRFRGHLPESYRGGNLPAVTTKELFHAFFLEPGTGRDCCSRHRPDRRPRRLPRERCGPRDGAPQLRRPRRQLLGRLGHPAAGPAGPAALPAHHQELPARHRRGHRRHAQDVTCGAAETKHFATAQYPGVPAQLNAVTADADLVTLTIGGNDNGVFIGAIVACGTAGAATSGFGSPCKDIYGSYFDDQVTTKTYPAVKKALQDIHAKAPNARVAILGYPAILPPTRAASPRCRSPRATSPT